MDNTDYFDLFLNNLFFYLTNKRSHEDDINIFRWHNNKLDVTGDISFSLNIKAWKKYSREIPIARFITESNNSLNSELFNNLLMNSEQWPIPITKFNIANEKLNIFLNRLSTFKSIITIILSETENYGSTQLLYPSKIEIKLDSDENNLSVMDLTQLRMKLLKNVIENLLEFTGNNNTTTKKEVIYLTNKSVSNIEEKKIICGVVIGNKFGKKNTFVTAEEYYNKRTIDMRLMAQHKYGVRVNSETGWAEFFEKLGNAAVTIDLLYVKLNRPIVINIENPTAMHSKGASFILYNCARLAAIFKQFEEKVLSGAYPPLPDINKIDFSLLNQPEEWELLFVYLLQYPRVIKSCIKDISDCRPNVHNLYIFLDSLCCLFSVYYRRIRILTEPREHLFPLLQARIYLLKSTQQVVHNALAILNIPPVKQM